jgi:hypothetical protein
VLYLNAQNPTAVLLAPVVFDDRALVPTIVLEETLPPPSPTQTPLNIESQVVDNDPVTCEFCSAIIPLRATNSNAIYVLF